MGSVSVVGKIYLKLNQYLTWFDSEFPLFPSVKCDITKIQIFEIMGLYGIFPLPKISLLVQIGWEIIYKHRYALKTPYNPSKS